MSCPVSKKNQSQGQSGRRLVLWVVSQRRSVIFDGRSALALPFVDDSAIVISFRIKWFQCLGDAELLEGLVVTAEGSISTR